MKPSEYFDDLRVEEVEVNGRKHWVRELSLDAKGEMFRDIPDDGLLAAYLLSAAICSEDGEPLFTIQDAPEISQFAGSETGSALNRVARRLNGLDYDEVKKTSETTPDSDSDSELPEK